MVDDRQPLSNIQDMDAATVDGFRKLLRLDKEIDAAIARHVQDLKDDRKEV